MKKTLVLLIAAVISLPTLYAGEVDALRDEISLLREQLQRLESRLEAQSEKTDRLAATAHEVEAKALRMEEDSLSLLESFAQIKEVNDRLSISGNVDVVAAYGDIDTGARKEDASDVFIDQVKLNLGLEITDNVKGFIGLQYEDYRFGTYALGAVGDTDTASIIEVDEAYIAIGEEEGVYTTVGKQYVPFGNVDEYGNFVNDTLARQLYETKDTGIVLGYRQAGMDLAVFGFNSTANSGGVADNKVETFGGSISFGKEEEDMTLKIGAGYINNLYASRNSNGGLLGWAGILGVPGGTPIAIPAAFTDELAAYNLYAVFAQGPLWLSAEYVAAWEDADPGDTTFGSDIRPSALSLEAALTVPLGDQDYTLAAKYEVNKDQDAYGNPIGDVWGLGISTEVYENTRLSLNYENIQASDRPGVANGHTTQLFLAELSISF